VKELARSGLGADRRGLRAQFVHLTSVAQLLSDGVALAPPE
jgi:hypothetical protein